MGRRRARSVALTMKLVKATGASASRVAVASSSSPVAGNPSFFWNARKAARVWPPFNPSSGPEEMPHPASAICASKMRSSKAVL